MATSRNLKRIGSLAVFTACVVCSLGCQTSKQQQTSSAPRHIPQALSVAATATNSPAKLPTASPIRLVAHRQENELPQAPPHADRGQPESLPTPIPQIDESLEELEAAALNNNPTLRRMQQEAAAEWAKTGHIAKLPDPTLGAMFYTPPMNFAPDRQVAELQLTQMIPWLSRLNAESQQAHMEALAADNMVQAERLRIIGDLRTTWFKLYVLGKQIQTTEAEKSQLESLIKTANARVAAGNAQPGDILLATLELSALQEQLISYRQQVAATTADLNRLAGRNAGLPITPPAALNPLLPEWDHDLLRQIASESQPELNAARMRTAATRWGIEVARLKRRPDLTFGAGWVVMDAPGSMMPGEGRDSFTLGVSSSLPIWHRKYDALAAEASRQHYAAHASEDEIAQRLDAMLQDLWSQAQASRQTVELYEKSILPQARQMFAADQKSLINNTVTFDRVIRDYRTLLNLELGYHRALGQLATTIARIRQTVGVDLLATPARTRQ